MVVHGQRVRVRGGASVDGDVATLLEDTVQSGAVNDHVLDDRVCGGAHRLDLQGVTIAELVQTLLTGRGVLARAVRTTVDVQTTGTTDTLTAVRCERERLLAGLDVLGVLSLIHI